MNENKPQVIAGELTDEALEKVAGGEVSLVHEAVHASSSMGGAIELKPFPEAPIELKPFPK